MLRTLSRAVSTIALVVSGGTVATVMPAASASGIGPTPFAHLASHKGFITPPTTAQCEQQVGLPCYAPFQFQNAYDLNSLYSRGLDGAGRTIVIVDSFGYQRIGSELATFDRAFHLPPPPRFSVLQPEGPIPPYNPTGNPMMVGWAQETSLDVEYAHAMAPGANILLVETPVAETLGVHGFPQIVAAENYVIDHKLGDVITQSFGAPEQGFPAGAIQHLRSAYLNAFKHHVTVLASSGDAGASGAKSLTPQGFASSFYLHRVVQWPASDPLVTGVGGTQLDLTSTGARIQPDMVWNDTNLFGSPTAGGGGLSTVFGRPWYQLGVARTVGKDRGVPDVSMSAAINGAALVYLDSGAAQGPAAFYLFGGTSEASPLLSGIVAIADQAVGHDVGLINPALYDISAEHGGGVVDVTAGTNTVTFPQNGSVHSVLGWDAVKGYDLSSGVGTIDGANFVAEMASAARA